MRLAGRSADRDKEVVCAHDESVKLVHGTYIQYSVIGNEPTGLEALTQLILY